MRKLIALLAVVALLAITAPSALAQNPHFVGKPSCSVSGGTLTCSGKIAGLGNLPTTVEIVATRTCENRGGNQPPGQVRGQSGPIQPKNGQITFNVSVSGGCPDQMTTSFVSPATVNVFQNSTLVFTGTISF